MPQIRVEKKNKYTQIDNNLIRNRNLSLKAKGLLIYMLSLPDDWDYSISGLSAECKEGKSSIRSAIDELMEQRYITRSLARGEGGLLDGYEYVVYEEQQPLSENRTTDNRTSENRTQQIKDLTNKEETNTPYSPPGSPADCLPGRSASPNDGPGDSAVPDSEAGIQPAAASDSAMTASSGHAELNCAQPLNVAVAQSSVDKPVPKPKTRRTRQKKSVPVHAPERFEQFWAYYPGGGSRLRAVTAWDNLAPSDELIDEMARALKRQKASRQWQDGVGIPHASTWLNQQRWTDKLPETPQPRNTGGWAEDPEVCT